MEAVHKERLVEEAKQRSFGDIIDRAHQGFNQEDAVNLRDDIIKVGICEAGTVRGLIEKIFDKALSDPTTSQTLADLCVVMPAHFDPVEGTVAPKEKGAGSRGSSERRIDFRLMVGKKVKEELEKGITHAKAVKTWEDREAEKALNGEEKKLYEAELQGKQRQLELVRFAGYLYSAGLISEKVIHSCIDTLLKDKEEPRHEDIETLTNLFKVIGPKLDAAGKSSKEGKIVAQYYDTLSKLKEDAISGEVAKMLEEVLTLKSNGWEQPLV